MTPTTLFGIALSPLFLAIAQVESEGGRTSTNVYQVTPAFVDDFNRITKNRYGLELIDFCRATWVPERAMATLWEHYGKCYARRGVKVTPEVMANIHRYGYEGSKQYVLSCIESPYWKKVKKHYDKFAKDVK